MKQIALALALTCATPLAAQDSDAPTLMERGAEMFLDGLLKQMEPALKEMENLAPQFKEFAQGMGPALVQLLETVEDWTAYEAPEVLPNGDIILRRKQPKPTPLPPVEDGQIDL